MGEDLAAKILGNCWMHSHEEDTASEMVFRSASFNFPRSRGREGFELRPDQSLVEIQPGAADRPEKTDGRWELQSGKKLVFFKHGSAQPTRSLNIVSANDDRLVVAKTAATA
jgi:hypothetical protein